MEEASSLALSSASHTIFGYSENFQLVWRPISISDPGRLCLGKSIYLGNFGSLPHSIKLVMSRILYLFQLNTCELE